MTIETLCKQDEIALTVRFNTVSIEITCRDEYEARVLFDDIASRFAAGDGIFIEPLSHPENQTPNTDDRPTGKPEGGPS